MPDTMTLPEKLRSAARSPDSWDLPGLLEDAAGRLDDAENRLDRLEAAGIDTGSDPEEDDEDDGGDAEHKALIEDIVARDTRREVVPGWTLEEVLQREG